MYTPAHFEMTSATEVLAALRQVGFGHLVSLTDDGLDSTPLPFVVNDDLSEVRSHFARANRHWRSLDGAEALMIVAGPDAYISPRWYPSKSEHQKVVPTWNYQAIHLKGRVEVCDDTDWKLSLVADLTDQMEAKVSDPQYTTPWAVADAPEEFIASQLKAIVGMRLAVTSIEAKHKLSQNKPAADQAGAIAGLKRAPASDNHSAAATAGLMESLPRP